MKNHFLRKFSLKKSYSEQHIWKKFTSYASLDEIREAAARICRDYLTGRWKAVVAEKLIVKRISGGLSNFLYYVSLPEDDTSADVDDAANVSDIACSSALTICDKNRNEANTTTEDNSNVCKRHRSDSNVNINSVPLKVPQAQQDEPREVLLRIYGQSHGEDALEAMITESVVFALLSERNFGPKLHGIFPGGRIEQYIPARPLSTVELSDQKISMKIAEKMGEIHSLNIPMSKEPDWLWNCMHRWLKSVNKILKKSDWKDNEHNAQAVREFDFGEETKWLKSVIDEGDYPVLFCHNDLQEGNILYRESDMYQTSCNLLKGLSVNFKDSSLSTVDRSVVLGSSNAPTSDNMESSSLSKRKRCQIGEGSDNLSCPMDFENNTQDSALSSQCEDSVRDPTDLIIIDFEYCAYNYRGFDLANHFLEWTFDYSNRKFPFFYHHKHQYPIKEQRHDFIKVYLQKVHEGTNDYMPTMDEVQKLESEVRVFSMFSHIFWSLWSVVNVTSTIEFGYWDYAVTRMREYQALKREFISVELTNGDKM